MAREDAVEDDMLEIDEMVDVGETKYMFKSGGY